jgi:hypothetical protein
MGKPAEKLFEEAARLTREEHGALRFLEVLEQAIELPESERRALASRVRDELRAARRPRRGALSWESLERAQGVVHLGGDAVEDCDRLYDG